MIEVKKKEGESSEALLRRFSRKVQQSGLLLRAKKGQYYTRDKSRTLRRKDAVQRSKIRSKNEYLRKVGKLEDAPQRGRPGYSAKRK